jgi:hypothetical protein
VAEWKVARMGKVGAPKALLGTKDINELAK